MVIVPLKKGSQRNGHRAVLADIMKSFQSAGVLKLDLPYFLKLYLVSAVIKYHAGVFHIQVIAPAGFDSETKTGRKRIPVPRKGAMHGPVFVFMPVIAAGRITLFGSLESPAVAGIAFRTVTLNLRCA